jgi:uncharacterized protein (TIGR03382 family)
VICLRDIFDCQTRITGATVTLDDGQVDVSNANGIYDFPAVPPRYACVDVVADGYEPAHKCHQVLSGMENYNSVALFPIGERPDAGPRPDGGIPGGVDAGIDEPPPGGCCEAGTGAPAGSAVLGLAVIASLRRRRGRRAASAGSLPA